MLTVLADSLARKKKQFIVYLMKSEKLLSECEKIVEDLGYELRKEKGSFKGDFCVLEGDRIVMLNKMYPPEIHLGQIVRFLMKQNLNEMYIKPKVRKELEDWFERIKMEQK